MIVYKVTIKWKDSRGPCSVHVEGTNSHEETFHEAMKVAKAAGWTPPRWWQWQRWNDRDYEKDYIKEVACEKMGQLDH
jgi:hypothetical protein